jgi:predicted component of type VI protein secretion system
MRIQLELAAESGAPEIKEFNQAQITIGRASKSDFVLQAKEASREHAVIECREEIPYLISKGRLPTRLNGQEMKAGAPAPLSSGDRIEICGEALSFQILAAPPNPLETLVSAASPTPNRAGVASPARKRTTDFLEANFDHGSKLAQEAKVLAKELNDLYRVNAATDPSKRRGLFKDVLKKRMALFGDNDRAEMIRILRDRFYNKEEVLERVISENQELQAKLEAYGNKEQQAMAAYQALSAVAKKLTGKAEAFQTAVELSNFCENLRQCMETLLSFVGDLEKERLKKPEHQLAQLETAGGEPALLQKVKSSQELGQYLLNWNHLEDQRQAHAQFKNALKVLLAHESALQAGYDGSLWSGAHLLLDRLQPGNFEKEEGNETWVGKLSKKWFGLLHGWFYWRRYKKKHATLVVEKKETFQSWFRPSFEAAYRDKIKDRLKVQ